MSADRWFDSFPAEIIVCNPEGIILDMNETATAIYADDGGKALIGRNVFSHHEEPVRSMVKQLVDTQKKSIYTTEKNGQKKLVTIAPWQQNQAYAGFVLLTIDLPEVISNIKKD